MGKRKIESSFNECCENVRFKLTSNKWMFHIYYNGRQTAKAIHISKQEYASECRNVMKRGIMKCQGSGKMDYKNLYFSDGFFSSGQKNIYTEDEHIVGKLDLKSAFTSTIDVLDLKGNVLISGKFPLFSNRWIVTNQEGDELGFLRARFSFFAKKYEYTAHNRGIFRIDSETFSERYEILHENGKQVGQFKKESVILSNPAYELSQVSEDIEIGEMIAVVMGVNAIKKRSHSAANSTV